MKKLLLTISPAIVAAIMTYFTVMKNIFSPLKIKIANEQLHKVYLPLFTFIEPYLYKKVPIDILMQFLDIFKNIKNNHYELIDSNLLNDIQILEKSIKDNEYCYECYDSVCRTLDKLFECTRKYLKLPTRNIFYRINNRQLNKSLKDIFIFTKNLFISSLPSLLLIFFFLIFYLFTVLIFYLMKIIIK